MQEHCLFSRIAFKKFKNTQLVNVSYDTINGMWFDANAGDYCCRHDKLPFLCTKKEDVEIGEDLKGV